MKKIINITILSLLLFSCTREIHSPEKTNHYPEIYPDYKGVTIPVNIAPLNFTVDSGNFKILDLKILGTGGLFFQKQFKTGVEIPIKKWHNLLKDNCGDSIWFEVTVENNDKWVHYKSFPMYVSPDSIDYGLVYRLISPGYETYSKMGIYERNLSKFKQYSIFENTQVTNSCVNCHTFNKGNPQQQSIHIRGMHGATIVKANGETKILESRNDSVLASCMYPYWHPSGKYIAYSTNQVFQVFHTTATDLIETYDKASDVLVYNVENDTLITCNLISGNSYETFPAFSADGKKLYFCTSPLNDLLHDLKKRYYSICSIDFDAEKGKFGNRVDTIVNVTSEEKSVSLPRPSYDGRYLMYSKIDYGNFPIYHTDADLWLLDLHTGATRALNEVNSSYSDGYHNWSSNSCWFVFESKRDGDMFARPYFAHIDENGNISKPFLLPQQNPYTYYQDLFFSYNCVEFVTGPIPFDAKKIERKVMNQVRTKMLYKKRVSQ